MNELRSVGKATARKSRVAMSLIELMCVIAIISILAALYLPAVAKAFVRIKTFLGGLQ